MLLLQIYLGGVDSFNKKGLTTRYNFNGCIDFVRFNSIDMIRDVKTKGGFQSRFQTVGPVAFTCSVSHNDFCFNVALLNFEAKGLSQKWVRFHSCILKICHNEHMSVFTLVSAITVQYNGSSR